MNDNILRINTLFINSYEKYKLSQKFLKDSYQTNAESTRRNNRGIFSYFATLYYFGLSKTCML